MTHKNTRTAVVICPGRGSYNKPDLGYLARYHNNDRNQKTAQFARFDALRAAKNQTSIVELDGADRYSVGTYSRGDIASPLIYAAALSDVQSIADDIEIVAVTGNSMGWYIALAAARALSPDDGFNVVNTMGTLMHENMIGGQLIYPFVDDNWRDTTNQKHAILASVDAINLRENHVLSLSINLGGMLVLAGNDAGLAAFETAHPTIQNRFPMRLHNHGAFHSDLQIPVAEMGRAALSKSMFETPKIPLIDGRGHVWWPHGTDVSALYDYTLNHQIIAPYDFTAAITTAAREFAPDLFIIAGPGDTLGGAVAQSLVRANWRNMAGKTDFQTQQTADPFLVSMGRPDQRTMATTRARPPM